MKIKTIGTGNIYVADRSACTLIDDHILVDCGNGAVKTLLQQGVNIAQIDAVLITHCHGDHTLDIPFLIIDRQGIADQVELQPLHIYCRRGLADKIYQIFNLLHPEVNVPEFMTAAKVEFSEFDSLNDAEVSPDYLVTSYEVQHHPQISANGYVIQHDDIRLGFSGDCHLCDGVEAVIRASDIALLDTTSVEPSRPHMSVHDVISLVNEYHKPVIATHMGRAARQYLMSERPDEITVPRDGDEFMLSKDADGQLVIHRTTD